MGALVDRLEGEVIRRVHVQEDGPFGILRIRDAAGAEHVAVGSLAHVPEGAHVVLEGRWRDHPRWGRRFRARSCLVEDPRTHEGLRRYLASGAVRGIGPEMARRIVEHFGLDTLHVLERAPERLVEVPGIGPRRLEEIVAHWERDRADREAEVALRGLGLGGALARRLLDRYGEGALDVVGRDPYRLAEEVAGVGFRTADRIARAAGIATEDPRRAEAALRHALLEAAGEGHCFLPEGRLLEAVAALDVPEPEARTALDRLLLRGTLVREPAADPLARPVWSRRMHALETGLARALVARAAGGSAPEAEVRAAAVRVGLEPDEEQVRAAALALGHRLAVVTGGPGTGKTTLIRMLVAAGRARGERWLLGAPTGRAAHRLAEACGAEAAEPPTTLHRMLAYRPVPGGFQRGPGDPLEADVVLVDEASMVDLELAWALLVALPEAARLVLVGDADQLPSVGPGQVLRDLLAAGTLPVAVLRRVYRQSRDSSIVRNAHRVLAGRLPCSSEREPGTRGDFFVLDRRDPRAARDTVLEVVRGRLPRLGFDPVADVQVLTPMHGGPLGAQELNRVLQEALNPAAPGRAELVRGQRRFRVGDRVLQLRNDHEREVYNGDAGRVVEAGPGGLVVAFGDRRLPVSGDRLDQLELAWAITIHKSQGSEYPAVVVVLDRAHHVLLRRDLLYTAITRARRFCCVVAHPAALARAVEQARNRPRYTRLAERLAGEAPR